MALSGRFKFGFVGGVSQLAAYAEFSMQRTRTAAGGPSGIICPQAALRWCV